MANKLDRIERDIQKTKTKIAELQKQLRELEAAKTEQENLQIVQLVRGLNMTPEEFAAFVRGGALQAPPAPQPDFEQDEQEDNADEEQAPPAPQPDFEQDEQEDNADEE